MADEESGITDADGPAYPHVTPMSDAEMACGIGDLLEVIATLELSGTMEDPMDSTVPATGQLYRVVSLFGRGWDLEIVSGEGPSRIRVLNRYVGDYFRRVVG